MTKLSKITITIGIIAIILATVLPLTAFRELIETRKENELLHNRIKQLEVVLNVKDIQLKDCQKKLTGAHQEIEYLTLKTLSDELYIDELQSRYLKLVSYANMAEAILKANGIEFYKSEGIGKD